MKPSLALFLSAALLLSGCVTGADGKQHWDGAKAGRVATAIAQNVGDDLAHALVAGLEGAVQAAASGDLSTKHLEQGAAEGVWKNAGAIDGAAHLQNVINAWSAGASPKVAATAAQVYAAANPQTPADQVATTNFIAQTISDAAAKAPASK